VAAGLAGDPILETIFEQKLSGSQGIPGRRPLGFLIAGPPGSGKSRLARSALEKCVDSGGSPVHVDSDKLRAYVPGYEKTAARNLAEAFEISQPLVSAWADTLRDHAIALRRDIVLEGLFKTESNTVALISNLNAEEYEMSLIVKVIPRAISLLQIEKRYEVQLQGRNGAEAVPRRLPAAGHEIGYDALLPLVALAERMRVAVSLRDINNDPIEELVADGSPKSASDTLLGRQECELTEEEQSAARAILRTVQSFRQARQAPPPEAGSALEVALSLIADWE